MQKNYMWRKSSCKRSVQTPIHITWPHPYRSTSVLNMDAHSTRMLIFTNKIAQCHNSKGHENFNYCIKVLWCAFCMFERNRYTTFWWWYLMETCHLECNFDMDFKKWSSIDIEIREFQCAVLRFDIPKCHGNKKKCIFMSVFFAFDNCIVEL